MKTQAFGQGGQLESIRCPRRRTDEKELTDETLSCANGPALRMLIVSAETDFNLAPQFSPQKHTQLS